METELPIQPLNTEWNRKVNMLDGSGKVKIIARKNGVVYFTWTDAENGTVFLKCEENFFGRNFKVPAAKPENATTSNPDIKKMKFLSYPFDLVKK